MIFWLGTIGIFLLGGCSATLVLGLLSGAGRLEELQIAYDAGCRTGYQQALKDRMMLDWSMAEDGQLRGVAGVMRLTLPDGWVQQGAKASLN